MESSSSKKYLAFISHHKLGSAAGSAWLVKDYLEEEEESDGTVDISGSSITIKNDNNNDQHHQHVFIDQDDDHDNIISLLQQLKLSKVVV